MFRTSLLARFTPAPTVSLLRRSFFAPTAAAASIFPVSALCFTHPRFFSNDDVPSSPRDELLRDYKQQFEAPEDKGDYFRIENVDDAVPPDSVVEWKFSRGSGPGGQAVNSGSNKAELRVNIQQWKMLDPTLLCDETFDKLVSSSSKHLAHGNTTLILSSHKNRSLDKNKEDCIEQVKLMVRQASYVPPAAAPRMKFDPRVLKQVVQKKHIKSNFNRMKKSAKASGRLSGSKW